jgi:hypothetical protein
MRQCAGWLANRMAVRTGIAAAQTRNDLPDQYLSLFAAKSDTQNGSMSPLSLGVKPSQLHFANHMVMPILSLFNLFLSRSKFPNLALACAILAPFNVFAQQYQETDQVSNTAEHGAKFVDPHLINPWGIARSSAGAWWVADEDAHVSTLYKWGRNSD